MNIIDGKWSIQNGKNDNENEYLSNEFVWLFIEQPSSINLIVLACKLTWLPCSMIQLEGGDSLSLYSAKGRINWLPY